MAVAWITRTARRNAEQHSVDTLG